MKYVEFEAKSNVKTLQGNAMSKTLQNGTFGGGVTHRIGSIRPRHGAQLSWRSEVNSMLMYSHSECKSSLIEDILYFVCCTSKSSTCISVRMCA